MGAKPHFIAGIKDTRLRRAGMLVVVPILLAPLILGIAVALWNSLCEACVEFGDHLRWETRHLRILKLGLAQMWSADWNPDQ